MLSKDSEQQEHTELHGQKAEKLFPDLFGTDAVAVRQKPSNTVRPPQPPGDTWKHNNDTGRRANANTPFALVLMQDSGLRGLVECILHGIGYQIVIPDSTEDACIRLRSDPYQVVVCDTEPNSEMFHEYICNTLNPSRRRLIYYVLIGPQLLTCYDIQALALSANTVVSYADLPHLEHILRRGFQEYEALFGPLLMELREEEWPVMDSDE